MFAAKLWYPQIEDEKFELQSCDLNRRSSVGAGQTFLSWMEIAFPLKNLPGSSHFD